MAAYLQYEPPKPAVRVDDAADLGPLLAGMPVVQAPVADDSAWLSRAPNQALQ